MLSLSLSIKLLIGIAFSTVYAASNNSCLTRQGNEIVYNNKGRNCVLLRSLNPTERSKATDKALEKITGKSCTLTASDNYVNAELMTGEKILNGSSRKVKCNSGYEGNITIYCDNGETIHTGDEECTYSGLTCETVDLDIGNGTIHLPNSNNNDSYHSIRPECHTGYYESTGTDYTYKCNDGVWTKIEGDKTCLTEGSCPAKTMEFDGGVVTLSAAEDGGMGGLYYSEESELNEDAGVSVSARCDKTGYIFEGLVIAMCNAGEWTVIKEEFEGIKDPPEWQCVYSDVCREREMWLDDGTYVYLNAIKNGSTLDVIPKCSYGYTLANEDEKTGFITYACNDGIWTNIYNGASCVPATCSLGDLDNILSSKIVGNIASVVTCSDGSCSSTVANSGINIKGNESKTYDYGTFITIDSCNSGYAVSGDKGIVRCGIDGWEVWRSYNVCEEIACTAKTVEFDGGTAMLPASSEGSRGYAGICGSINESDGGVSVKCSGSSAYDGCYVEALCKGNEWIFETESLTCNPCSLGDLNDNITGGNVASVATCLDGSCYSVLANSGVNIKGNESKTYDFGTYITIDACDGEYTPPTDKRIMVCGLDGWVVNGDSINRCRIGKPCSIEKIEFEGGYMELPESPDGSWRWLERQDGYTYTNSGNMSYTYPICNSSGNSSGYDGRFNAECDGGEWKINLNTLSCTSKCSKQTISVGNGEIFLGSATNGTVVSNVALTCNTGYMLSGDTDLTYTCDEGRWVQTDGNKYCEEASCSVNNLTNSILGGNVVSIATCSDSSCSSTIAGSGLTISGNESIEYRQGEYITIESCASGYATPEDKRVIYCGDSGWEVTDGGSNKCHSGIYETKTFSYTGSAQVYTVPDKVSSIVLEICGGQGGDSELNSRNGGKGGYSYGTLSVNAGDVLSIIVGGAGAGGASSGAGGGGSAIKLNGTVVIVAGGGGGAANYNSRGGAGGGGNRSGGYSYGGWGTPGANGFGNDGSDLSGGDILFGSEGGADGADAWGASGFSNGGYGYGKGGNADTDKVYGAGGGGYGGGGSAGEGGGGGGGYVASTVTNGGGSSGACSGNGRATLKAYY